MTTTKQQTERERALPKPDEDFYRAETIYSYEATRQINHSSLADP